MPPPPPTPPATPAEAYLLLKKVADETAVYPIEAYEFVQRGLGYTVRKIHGPARQTQGRQAGAKGQNKDEMIGRHVSGQQLCDGLRQYAVDQWGFLAKLVLQRWNIRATNDFGRIVFNLAQYRVLATTERDTIEDFNNVFDFKTAFEGYAIPAGK